MFCLGLYVIRKSKAIRFLADYFDATNEKTYKNNLKITACCSCWERHSNILITVYHLDPTFDQLEIFLNLYIKMVM